jgi:hypothetical protein
VEEVSIRHEVEIGVRSSHVVDAGDPVVISRSTLRFPARDYRTTSSARGEIVAGRKFRLRERDQGTREGAANRAILITDNPEGHDHDNDA